MAATKETPFFASIKERYCLNRSISEKSTYHLALNLQGSDIRYQVGDSLAIAPCNDPLIVNDTLVAMNASGQEPVADKKTGEELPLRDHLTRKVNLASFNKSLLKLIESKQNDAEKKQQ